MHDVTYEEYQIVEYLRGDACASCIFNNYVGECTSTDDCLLRKAADLIESLSEELEQVKRERDAAVNDLKLWHCFSCNNKSTPYCQECSRNRVRLIKGYMSGRDHYEWCGVKEENNG